MKIFIEQTPGNEVTYKVCNYSIVSRNSSLETISLDVEKLKAAELYRRPDDSPNLSKFLVPMLSDYDDWALYCGPSVFFLSDVSMLLTAKSDQYAVMIVKHKDINADNSIILWNCSHPKNKKLSTSFIEENSVDFLNSFSWLKKEDIGELHFEWNWVSGFHKPAADKAPKSVYFPDGGPWLKDRQYVEYGYHWLKELTEYQKTLISPPPPGPFDFVPPDINSVFTKILKYRVDPLGEIYNTQLDEVIEDIKMLDNKNVVAVDGGRDANDGKGLGWDPYMESFVLGAGGQITNYDKVAESMTPVVFRGITKHKHMKACEAVGRDFYYIDTGYFGNVRKKLYHRITKNAMQNIGPVIERPFDRLSLTGWQKKKFRPGRNILICPPSAKAMSCFGLDLAQWMEETVATIKHYTDRPIVIREKVSRRARTSTDTMEMALANDVHCLVTYNSIAATEALLNGKPAFTLGPNAAHSLCLNDLTRIETPYIPTLDEVEAWAAHLAYSQFTEAEMKDGTAWRILNNIDKDA